MAVDIHSRVQHSNDIERARCFSVEQNVRARRILPIAIAHGTDTTGFVAAGQGLHRCQQIIILMVGLLERPLVKRIAPGIFEICPPAA